MTNISDERDDEIRGQPESDPGTDYLWDRTGPPDPTIVELEQALAGARWRRRSATPSLAAGRRRLLAACAAALFVAALGASGFGLWSAWRERAPGGHDVAAGRAAGSESTAAAYRAEALSGVLERTELRVGDRLVTDLQTRARLTIGDIGSVVVEPDTRVRVEAAGKQHALYLERGALTASIFAAPRLFQVGTPSGIAVDLGCVYTASVQDDGVTQLSVIAGRVSFETEGRQVTVPSGASSLARPGTGPGTPVWDDAPAAYRQAVAHMDELLAEAGDTAANAGDAVADSTRAAELAMALDPVLDTDRTEDSLTLWHLLAWTAVPESLRARVLGQLARLSPPPEGLSRKACLALDAAALQRWREAFAWSS